MAYSISAASIHDIRLVPELIDQYACSHVLADVGYLSQPLKDQLKQRHIIFDIQPSSICMYVFIDMNSFYHLGQPKKAPQLAPSFNTILLVIM